MSKQDREELTVEWMRQLRLMLKDAMSAKIENAKTRDTYGDHHFVAMLNSLDQQARAVTKFLTQSDE